MSPSYRLQFLKFCFKIVVLEMWFIDSQKGSVDSILLSVCVCEIWTLIVKHFQGSRWQVPPLTHRIPHQVTGTKQSDRSITRWVYSLRRQGHRVESLAYTIHGVPSHVGFIRVGTTHITKHTNCCFGAPTDWTLWSLPGGLGKVNMSEICQIWLILYLFIML